jgi:hypothetical protein
LADQFIWEFADGAWGLGSRVHRLILEAGDNAIYGTHYLLD